MCLCAWKSIPACIWSVSNLSPSLILSPYECIYTYKSIHHTHTHTHVFSLWFSLVNLCLSLGCVWSREGGGFPLSLNVCVCTPDCTYEWEGGRELGRWVWVYPGTPGITVPKLSFTLCLNEKDLARFEIEASQVLIRTHSGTIHGNSDFWEERKRQRKTNRHWYQDFPCTCIHDLTFSHYPTHFHTTQIHKKNVCVCVCVCVID